MCISLSENVDFNSTNGQPSNMQKIQEKPRLCRTWMIILKTSLQFNGSGQEETLKNVSQNIKVLWLVHVAQHYTLRIYNYVNVWTELVL